MAEPCRERGDPALAVAGLFCFLPLCPLCPLPIFASAAYQLCPKLPVMPGGGAGLLALLILRSLSAFPVSGCPAAAAAAAAARGFPSWGTPRGGEEAKRCSAPQSRWDRGREKGLLVGHGLFGWRGTKGLPCVLTRASVVASPFFCLVVPGKTALGAIGSKRRPQLTGYESKSSPTPAVMAQPCATGVPGRVGGLGDTVAQGGGVLAAGTWPLNAATWSSATRGARVHQGLRVPVSIAGTFGGTREATERV